MAGKRQATTNLNHDNWDEEEEPEERGTFRKATEDELKNRVIKKARRKVGTAVGGSDTADDGAPKSVFSGFAGFGNTAVSTSTASPFSFLSKIPEAPVLSSDTSDKTKIPAPFFSFSAEEKTSNASGKKRSILSVENGSGAKDKGMAIEKSASYRIKIQDLNQTVSKWIQTHVDKNPVCILTPIFKDYEQYLNEIEEDEKKLEKSQVNENITNTRKPAGGTSAPLENFTFVPSSSAKLGTNTTTDATTSLFSFSTASPKSPASTPSIFGGASKAESEPTKTKELSFGIKPAANKSSATDSQASPLSSGFSFSYKSDNNQSSAKGAEPSIASKGFSFGLKSDDTSSTTATMAFTFGKPAATNGDPDEKKSAGFSFTPVSTPFSFGNIKPPETTVPSTSGGGTGDDDEEDQPPKVEFKQVVEEDSIYTKKCKIFIKKDGMYGDRGVGTLYLKPVKDSEKTQLLVRADTNLGNILVNLILSTGIPTQRMGKNNVMMVCFPTPDVEKVTPILLRVKTAEEADELLSELEKHKK